MPLYLTIVYFVYSFIYVLKVGDERPFGANVITFTMYRLWIKCSYSSTLLILTPAKWSQQSDNWKQAEWYNISI